MPLFDILEFRFDSEPRSASVNMAMDEVILREASVPVLRVYRWLRPAVSFGCFEKYSAVEDLYPSREPVRRWTGGGVVLHGEDFTYSLMVPRGCALGRMGPGESYFSIHKSLAQTLGTAGTPASIAGDDSANISRACFEKAVRHDVLLGNRKIAGAAQRRARSGLLHQGSIQGVELPPDFAERFAATLAGNVINRPVGQSELAAALALAESKYATAQWTQKF